jgi:O-antigen/teichoic acid export membrane protein
MTVIPARLVESQVPGPPKGTESSSAAMLTPQRLRVWGLKSALSLTDQALTSLAGFGVNLLLARWITPQAYGAFAVAFAGFLFVSGFHNVLLLEPMSVIGPARYTGNLTSYFKCQIVVHTILVGSLAAVLIIGSLVLRQLVPVQSLTEAIVGGSLALPFLLLAWLGRRMCYVMQRPALAVQGSALYTGLIAVGLAVLAHVGYLGAFTAFILMGCGSAVVACFLLWRLGVFSLKLSVAKGVRWRAVLRENWSYGRWLVGSTVLFSVSSQAQMFFAAGILGLSAAGILRAMQLPSLVMTQVTTAAGLLILPSFSYDFANGLIAQLRTKAILVSVSLLVAAFFFAALLALFARRAEYVLYGGRYAPYAWLMPVLALMPVCSGLSMGHSMALRSMQKPYFDLISNLFAAPVAVMSAFFLMRWLGLAGAAISMVLSFLVMTSVTVLFFRRSFRSLNHVCEDHA